MNIKEMHYAFKFDWNKIDSSQNRNFEVPEIDYILNAAQNLFVKLIAQPRLKNHLGFETTQRTIDDIRTVVKDNISITVTSDIAPLPTDYQHYLRAYALVTKGNCVDKRCRVLIKQHDDEFDESPFDRSNFGWRFQNALFTKDGLKFFPDGTVTKVYMNYIKKLDYIHNAEDYSISGYRNFNGTMLTGVKNCELPDQTHSEIVDIAVLLASGNLQSPDYQIRQAKLNLNQII